MALGSTFSPNLFRSVRLLDGRNLTHTRWDSLREFYHGTAFAAYLGSGVVHRPIQHFFWQSADWDDNEAIQMWSLKKIVGRVLWSIA